MVCREDTSPSFAVEKHTIVQQSCEGLCVTISGFVTGLANILLKIEIQEYGLFLYKLTVL